MSAVVGRQLVSLDYNNQREEAAYRKELVYAEDGVDGRGSAETLRALFLRVRATAVTVVIWSTSTTAPRP